MVLWGLIWPRRHCAAVWPQEARAARAAALAGIEGEALGPEDGSEDELEDGDTGPAVITGEHRLSAAGVRSQVGEGVIWV